MRRRGDGKSHREEEEETPRGLPAVHGTVAPEHLTAGYCATAQTGIHSQKHPRPATRLRSAVPCHLGRKGCALGHFPDTDDERKTGRAWKDCEGDRVGAVRPALSTHGEAAVRMEDML